MLAGMGTELQFSQNFFASLPRSYGGPMTMTFETLDDRSSSRNIHQMGNPRLKQPSEALECAKNSLKKTILNHEKIFRDQVRELHRVYRIQKLLMAQLREGGAVAAFSSNLPIDKLSKGRLPSCSNECDLDLTLSIGGGEKRKIRSSSHSESKFGCCPESSSNSTGRRAAAFTPARSDSGAPAGPICRC